MGIPHLYFWLTKKYPSIVAKTDTNNAKFDNLYLDMNGILAECMKPKGNIVPKTEDEVMIATFVMTDRIINIVRPRKLIFLAIDGVVPLAKINNQRSRRYFCAKRYDEMREDDYNFRASYSRTPKKNPNSSMSNCTLMDRLSTCLNYYIHQMLNKTLRNLKVILSDSHVPGEAEHKIIDFIRKQRVHCDHDPNTKHCVFGADSDLIMLGLGTHEVNFTIMREQFFNKKLSTENHDNLAAKKYIFIHLCNLRQYLRRDLTFPDLPFKYDFERIIDDWVFLCLFIGNDFLPNLPSLDIMEDALDHLVCLYKKCIYKVGCYLTMDGQVDVSKVQFLLNELGKEEKEVFQQRRVNKISKKSLKNLTLVDKSDLNPDQLKNNTLLEINNAEFQTTPFPTNILSDHKSRDDDDDDDDDDNDNNDDHDDDDSDDSVDNNDSDDSNDSDSTGNVEIDETRLWDDGYKERYYELKFDVSYEDVEFRSNLVDNYIRGLCWIMKYYYQGCPSWEWYYPYHYAPFASDFQLVTSYVINFPRFTKPLKPLEQMMAVLPSKSSAHVPAAWQHLMTSIDSPIIDFYPTDFNMDMDGKNHSSKRVILLPFIDLNRLLAVLTPLYNDLTPEEIERNRNGYNRLYVGPENIVYNYVCSLYTNKKIQWGTEIVISFEGMQGSAYLCKDITGCGSSLNSPIKSLSPVERNEVIFVKYFSNYYGSKFSFKSILLKGAIEMVYANKMWSSAKSYCQKSKNESSARNLTVRNTEFQTRIFRNFVNITRKK